jgi:phenylalanyl-tRNA synthetase beta chain
VFISLKWLKDYINLDGISAGEIEDKLTLAGLEVDDVIDKNKIFENIVVGYVKEKKKHPNADKLSLCVVSDGKEDFNVVCGAPNVEANQKVVFAKVGAVIPSFGEKLTKAKIRGEHSFGMICSEKELEISNNHDGIMVLDDSLEPGTPIAKALGMDDVIYEVAITPNRADALSHYGVARDLAAIYNIEAKLPEINYEEKDFHSSDLASVEIENTEGCPRFVGKVIKNITIKESPEWLKQKLVSIGSRPISNVVDITNYLLHELGQPMHAYDLDTLAGNKIIVKNAEEGEKFITLDSKERKLKSSDLMICDAERSVGIAGVMGGENTEVTANTKNVLIECAYFNPSMVRKSAKHLNMSTDASYRFERGTNPEMPLYAARRAAQLIGELAEGEIAKGEIDVYPEPLQYKDITLRFARIDKILGYYVAPERVSNIFEKLQFKIKEKNDETLLVSVPPFRHDIEREIDLIEEVARINGYEKIPAVEKITVTMDERIDQSEFKGKIRNSLSALGFNEIYTNSLMNKKAAENFGEPVNVINPQNIEMSHLRPSLIPGMLWTLSKNIKVKETDLKFFEIGKVFQRINEKIEDFKDFTESERLLIAITGKKNSQEWYAKENEYNFYDLNGYLGEFLSNILLDNKLKDSYYKNNNRFYDYYSQFHYKKDLVIEGGKLKGDILDKFDIKQNVFVYDINLSLLNKIHVKERKFRELLKYPKVIRDLAFVLDKSVDAKEVMNCINDNSCNLLKNIKLFDIFESESLGTEKKSLAFQLEYYDYSRTLTEEEVDKDFWNIIEEVKSKFKAQLRG